MEKKITAKVGETFKVGEYELIRVKDQDGGVAVVFKDLVFNSRFGEDNNFAKSTILKRLEEEILPKLESALGAENILEFETDLTSLDGSKKHGTMRSNIGLPTFDFYRENRAIFESHKVDHWWWLATPWETSEYTDDNWTACVSPRGLIGIDYYYYGVGGVRPFLIFSSSIFVS